MKISILAINFAPEHTGIGPYTTALAEHLARTHEVTVFAGVPHYPEWRQVPAADRPPSTARRGNLTIRRCGHYVPQKQDAVRRLAYEVTWTMNVLRSAWSHPADVIIAVVPALLASAAATVLARRSGARVGVIVQDVMSTAARQSGVRGGGLVARAAGALEGWGLRRSDGVVTIHPRLADSLFEIFELAVRPRVIPNWSHVSTAKRSQAAYFRRSIGWSRDDFIVLHSGNMGLKQDLGAVIDAARLAASSKSSIKFVLAGAGSQADQLKILARGVDRVEVIAGVPDAEYPSLLAAADALLINERPGMRDMSLPSKVTSYLMSGRPVIAATASTSATAAYLELTEACVFAEAGNPQSLLAVAERLRDSPDAASRLGRSGLAFAHTVLDGDRALGDYDAWLSKLTKGITHEHRSEH